MWAGPGAQVLKKGCGPCLLSAVWISGLKVYSEGPADVLTTACLNMQV